MIRSHPSYQALLIRINVLQPEPGYTFLEMSVIRILLDPDSLHLKGKSRENFDVLNIFVILKNVAFALYYDENYPDIPYH